MRVTKYNPFTPFPATRLDRFFDDVAGRSISEFLGSDFVNATPQVNIIENEKSFDIEVAAPGLSKENFSVTVDNDRLVVAAKKEEQTAEGATGKFTRREYNYSSFTRSFQLSDDIAKDSIDAKYLNGILTISLAKAEPEVEVKRTIEID